jgi:glycerol-3-phosphate acyltransferase PlsY
MDVPLFTYVLIAVIAYLLGSIPSAYLIGRLRGINIFEVGSGNMGATNIVRSTGLGWGALVWFFDSAKAVIAMAIAAMLLPEQYITAQVVAAVFAIIGHNWSVFAAIITGKIRGGKGAAATFGTMIAFMPPLAIAAMLAVATVIILTTRFVSLGVLIMFGVGAVLVFVLVAQNTMAPQYAVYAPIMMSLLLVRFRENIQRLLRGTERRFGEKSSTA